MTTRVTPGQLGMATPFGELLGHSDAEMNAEFADYAELGVDWLRTDFWWGLVQPTANGGYDWSLIDKVVDTAAKHGIKVVGLLNGNPPWVSNGFTSIADQQAFGKFAGIAAAHFKGRVDFWEILNEQNMAWVSPANYTKVLKAAYTAIKAVDATDTVITGGTAAVPATGSNLWGAVDYLKQMYANGAKGYFDAVGFHPYTFPLLPEDQEDWNGWQIMVDGIRQMMVANGDSSKKIWMTELGAPTSGGSNALSQADQALLIEQATDLAKDYSWAGPIMWYSYQDRGGSGSNTENWYGLITPNGERKDAYYAYKALATQDVPQIVIEKPTFEGRTYIGDQYTNLIIGNNLNNFIDGGAGDDVIKGGNGKDIIQGAIGNDMLWGGAGNDIFLFVNPKKFGYDRIRDFQSGDKIDISHIDANSKLPGKQDFKFIGYKWMSKPGDLGFYQDHNKNLTYVEGDINGDGAYDFSIMTDGIRSFTVGDFIL